MMYTFDSKLPHLLHFVSCLYGLLKVFDFGINNKHHFHQLSFTKYNGNKVNPKRF